MRIPDQEKVLLVNVHDVNHANVDDVNVKIRESRWNDVSGVNLGQRKRSVFEGHESRHGRPKIGTAAGNEGRTSMRRIRVFVLATMAITLSHAVLSSGSPAMARQRTAPDRTSPSPDRARIATPQSTRAIDAFLKMGDVKGESTASAHEDWFEVTAWSFEGSGDPAALSRRQSAGAITVQLERSNPALTEACTGGRSLGTVILHLRSGENPAAYDEYRLEQSSIRACGRMSAGSGGSVTLAFTRLKAEPAAGNPDRPVVIGR